MTPPTVRDRVLRAVEDLPATTTFDEVMERIYILQKVERGREQIASGDGIPHDEARRGMKQWHA